MAYHLKLKKGRSYSGIISATRKNPDVYTDDEAVAKKAVASSFFTLVEDEEKAATEEKPTPTGKKLADLTKTELETFAAYKGISLKGLSRKADIAAKIRESLPEDERSGYLNLGSPTMTELQE